MAEIELTGTNPLTFPELESWEWPVPAYLFVGGLVAGLMILSSVFRLRRIDRFGPAVRVADLTALPVLAIGLLLLWLDLSNKLNAWRFFTTFQVRSAMSWGSWILLMALVILGLRLAVAATTRPTAPMPKWTMGVWDLLGRVGEKVKPRMRWVDLAGLVVGVGLGFYTGILLSSIEARPLWDSAWLAPLFLVSGLAAGGAFLCLFLDHETHVRLAPLSMVLCAVELALIGGFVWSLRTGSEASRDAGELILGGPFTVWFWAMIVGLGLLVPLGIEVWEQRGHVMARRIGRAAPVLKLAGSAALRFVIVFAGLQSVL